MTKYLIRRILFFIPTLFIISLLAFSISVNAPGDPVERLLSSSQNGDQNANAFNRNEQEQYWRQKLGLNLPLFYFSVHSFSTPDTLYKIYDSHTREALLRLVHQYGNWEGIGTYYSSILNFEKLFDESPSFKNNFAPDQLSQIKNELLTLTYTYDDSQILYKLNTLSKADTSSLYVTRLGVLKKNYENINSNSAVWKNYIPCISFYKNNQYANWLLGDGTYSRGILRGDFGISYITKQPVSKVIGEKIFWSLFFTIVSILIAYAVSIPLGAKAGSKKNSTFDKTSSLVLFILYSLPVFWVATLLLMTFANQNVFHFFPASGVKPAGGYAAGASIFEKIKISLPYLILPTICYTYSSFAFLSRTMRVSMLEEINRDYIRTARAKGLPESKVIYKHAFRNALFPIITVFANVFPLVIGGSVLLETIFTIPGMGLETYTAIQNQNYPVIVAVFTITGMLTLAGYLVSDILYSITDPRVSFKPNKE